MFSTASGAARPFENTGASASSTHGRGTMLWFNAAKDAGVLRTEDGARIDVTGAAFAPGEKPAGRCGGKAIEFGSRDGAIFAITFLPEPSPRRARLRHRR